MTSFLPAFVSCKFSDYYQHALIRDDTLTRTCYVTYYEEKRKEQVYQDTSLFLSVQGRFCLKYTIYPFYDDRLKILRYLSYL